ncbi:hypothetical protein [Vibrio cholerae]|uniref:hypothetical protein n=1 Tax=Vibrio cholerae TaxID=666 RepID=UPI000D36FAA8|nr:hypothetical protein [Vibrio cholerae]
MPHLANEYIRNHVITGHSPQISTIPSQIFSQTHISSIRTELQNDSTHYLYSALISFIDALNGLNSGYYSWPTVKLYYSVFYSLRAYLGLNEYCIFYVGNKPFSINLKTENTAKKEGGNTHKVVLDVFRRVYADNVLLTQDIAQKHPFEWLVELREVANYKNPKFCEPNTPAHFSKIKSLCLLTVLQSYCADNLHLHTFDEDHAAVAYPLKILKMVLGEFLAKGLTFEDADTENIINSLTSISGAQVIFSELI